MASTVVRTQLTPVDVSKSYPQWGRVKVPATATTAEQLEWTQQRLSDSSHFRETNGPFENGKNYEVEIKVSGFAKPFVSAESGEDLNMGNPDSERQANYPFAFISQLPIYYEISPAPPGP